MNAATIFNKYSGCGIGIALLLSSLAAAEDSPMQTTLQQWLGDQPGGVAAAVIDAKGVVFANAGKFSADDARPITPDTEFEIGSVTKVFTALLLADSVSAGKVKLADKVGAPFAASEITYEQLATHTSGLPRLPADFMPADPLNPYADQSLAVLEESYASAASGAKPTATMVYSNFGFAVLGQALASAWGQPYETVLAERILRPLQLNDTAILWRRADPARLAPGHDERGAAGHWDLNAYAPAGTLVSTTRDMAKLVQACLGLTETPLAAVLAEAAKPRAAGDTPTRRIGLAWIVETSDDRMIVWHNGGTGGYRSFVASEPNKRVGVVVLTNHTRGVEPLGWALLDGKPLPKPQGSMAPAEALKPYLGNYPLTPDFVIAITADGERLLAQATNQPRLMLRAMSADRYAIEEVKAEIAFERDAGGKVTALVLNQNGVSQRAPHLAPGERPTAPKEVALTEQELDDCAGSYQLGPATFMVKREGGRLMVQLSGQPFFPVFASAKDEFFYRVVNAQLSFVRGADARVVALILHQNGRDQRAEKQR